MASRKISDCVPELQEKIPLIVQEYNETYLQDNIIIKPICTLRSTAEQLSLFKIGRVVEMVNGIPVVKSVDNRKIVTKLDGITKLSRHNPTPKQPLSRAVDFGVFCGGKYLTEIKYYEPLLELARKHGLISGLDFGQTGKPLTWLKNLRGFKDAPHMETKG